MSVAPAHIHEADETGADNHWILSGKWSSLYWKEIRETSVNFLGKIHQNQKITLDAQPIERFDLTGALLLDEFLTGLKKAGAEVELTNLAQSYQFLLDRASSLENHAPEETVSPRPFLFTLNFLGKQLIDLGTEAVALLNFFGRFCLSVKDVLLSPSKMRWTSLAAHIEQTGVRAVGIVGLLAFLIGVVLAFQSADQLQKFGAEIFTVNLLGISILREIGILITAIIVAGRSGSAFTAQIGTMKANQEVDALEIIGLNPVEVLAVPRVFALIITLPLLSFYASIISILGGAAISWILFDISWLQFYHQFKGAVDINHLWVGLIKAPFFAVVIALVGCFQGLNVTGSAESVGSRTTDSVVSSIFLVIVCDAIFSVLFSILGV